MASEIVVHGRDGRVRYIMKVHYSRKGARRTACGKRVYGIIDSHIKSHVTCESCKKTEAYRAAKER